MLCSVFLLCLFCAFLQFLWAKQCVYFFAHVVVVGFRCTAFAVPARFWMSSVCLAGVLGVNSGWFAFCIKLALFLLRCCFFFAKLVC